MSPHWAENRLTFLVSTTTTIAHLGPWLTYEALPQALDTKCALLLFITTPPVPLLKWLKGTKEIGYEITTPFPATASIYSASA
jgi:hypothetical protein